MFLSIRSPSLKVCFNRISTIRSDDLIMMYDDEQCCRNFTHSPWDSFTLLDSTIFYLFFDTDRLLLNFDIQCVSKLFASLRTFRLCLRLGTRMMDMFEIETLAFGMQNRGNSFPSSFSCSSFSFSIS